ncbi:MAG: hypothetical protein ACKO9G_08300, partial [Dolichospermum sp.]
FKQWVHQNNSALFNVMHLLTTENQKTLKMFENARQSGLPSRVIKIKKLGIYRQTLFGQLGLMVGVFFNKI